MRNLILVLGDQLTRELSALRDVDPAADVVVMAEVRGEVRAFPNHKQRVALFLAAMRHFRDLLREEGLRVDYQALDDEGAQETLVEVLVARIEALRPEQVLLTEPGRHDLREALREACANAGVPCELRNDTRFLASHDAFAAWAEGRKQLRMEYFYREMRKRWGVLMEGDQPAGGKWNYDASNRESFGSDGPGEPPAPLAFAPDPLTREVLELVEERCAELPGSLEAFDWPVTRPDALRALDDFVAQRLPSFGDYQDAMWTGETYLYHSRISAALNLGLLDPREVIQAAEVAYQAGDVPLNAAEGFIRQVLGWREFIRGVYWLKMPAYLTQNALDARRDLPDLFWSGETEMRCMRETVGQLLRTAYAHHIQRLMVAGLFAQLYGAHPRQVHEWFMAFYVDSVEWVTLPNVIGMSQHADGGIVGSKPYVATGKYVSRMSNYCQGCPYDPADASGDDACPFTTLYWDFLLRHEQRFRGHQRMALQVRNLDRKDDEEKAAIQRRARIIRRRIREGKA